MKKLNLLLLALIIGICAQAQISVPGTPPSFATKQLNQNLSVQIMPSIDLDAIAKEDIQDEAAGLPPRFGYPMDVDFNLTNSGLWETLPNGDRIWRLRIKCKDAKSINLLFDRYRVAPGSELYIYSADRRHVIGAFTTLNHKPDGRFGTGLVYGEETILEYVVPAGVTDRGEISIYQVIHGYRYIEGIFSSFEEDFGGSGSCQVNVNCSPEGDGWQDEKNAVAMILVSGFRNCTGSLVTTTRGDCTPYFLTADHCVGSLDAVTNPNASNYSFYWMYESPGCPDGTDFLPPLTNGATLMANDSPSDFALFLLTESPADVAGANPYFNGWDATFSPGTDGVGIHHPSGDIKKIATHDMVPLPDDWFGSSPPTSHWEVAWSATPNGHSVTEGGSSGSPLINAAGRTIGQLHGGSSINCSDPANDPGIYGAVAYSWLNAGAVDVRRKLQPWLDPDNTGTLLEDGTYGICEAACASPSGLDATSITTTGADLSWNLVDSAVSYLVRIRVSPAGAWNVFASPTTTYTASGLTACTNYEYQVASVCATDTSFYTSSLGFKTDGCPCPTYCVAGGGTQDEWIETITVGALVNNSGDNGGYIDYTGSPFTATYDQGMTYSLSLTPGYSGTIYSEWFRIWIDYNQDGDFADAGEMVYDAGATTTTTVTGSFTVPASALDGTTGMRVIMEWNAAPLACGTFTYGEVEDYCVTIGEAVACPAPTGLVSDLSNMPTDFTLSWTPVPGATQYQIKAGKLGSGFTRTINTTSTSNTFGGTHLSPSNSYNWKVRANCGAAGASGYSAVDTFSTGALRQGISDAGTEINLFPNPAGSHLYVDILASREQLTEVRILDLPGKVHMMTTAELFTGSNQIRLETSGLASGAYLLQIVMDNEVLVRKFTVQ